MLLRHLSPSDANRCNINCCKQSANPGSLRGVRVGTVLAQGGVRQVRLRCSGIARLQRTTVTHMAERLVARFCSARTSLEMNNESINVSLNDPVWTIHHVAACFHVTPDTAREYTYRADFPGAHALGSRLLWDREDVLSWFRELPQQTVANRRRKVAPAPAVHPTGVASYRPRSPRRSA